MIVMNALVRGSDSSATTAAKNYHNYALPFLVEAHSDRKMYYLDAKKNIFYFIF
jgi:hypothetical protein